LGRVEIVTLRVGVRAKEGQGGGGGEKKILIRGCFSFSQCFQADVFSSFSPPPSPLPLTRRISSSLREFQHSAFAIKTIRAPDENACTAG